MALITATRTNQKVVHAEFSWNWDDTMVPAAGGAATGFKPLTTVAVVYDVIALPPGAVVLSGGLEVLTTFATVTTYAIIVGDSATTNRYLATADRKGAASTVALVPTGYVSLGEPIRLTITPTGTAATAGKATLRVSYVVNGRADGVRNV